MLIKGRSKARRILATILAILLVSYNIPFGAIVTAFAQDGEQNNVFSLQVVDAGVPVPEQLVTAQNTNKEVFVEGTTNQNGLVTFENLTHAQFGENHDFEFTVGEHTFVIEGLREGTTDAYIYEVATGQHRLISANEDSTPVEEEPGNLEDEPDSTPDEESTQNPEEEGTTPPAEEEYNLSVNKTGEGTVLINGAELTSEVSLLEGEEVTFEITPDKHYEIDSVTIVTEGKEEAVTVTDKQAYQDTFVLSEDTEIVVVFTKIMHSLTIDQKGSGKVILSDAAENHEIKPGKVAEGTEVQVELTPEEGYEIHTVTMVTDGEEETKKVSNKQYFKENIVISADTEIHVEFMIKTYTITFNRYENGTVEDDQDQTIDSVGGIIEVLHNNESSFTVFPNEGYHVERIVIEDENKTQETITDFSKLEKVKNSDGVNGYKYTFKQVKKNYTVKVTFTINTYQVTASVTNGKGTIKFPNDDETTEVHHGSAVKVTMKPEDGYQIAFFKIDDKVISTDIENDENFKEDNLENISYTVNDITKDTNIQVGFEEVPQVEASWEEYLTLETNPTDGYMTDAIIENGENKLVRVYSKNAQLKLKAKEPFNKLNLNNDVYSMFFGWEREYSLNTSRSIHHFLVKTNGWKNVNSIYLTKPLLILFDKKKPELSDVRLNDVGLTDAAKWYDGGVTVTLKANDKSDEFNGVKYSTGIEKVYYSKGNKSQTLAKEATYDTENNHYIFETLEENYQGVYSIWAVDKAGNSSDVQTIEINTDIDAPILKNHENHKAVIFEEVELNLGQKILNFFTFGTYFSDSVKVTVKAIDNASGIKRIALIARDSEGNISDKFVSNLSKWESDIENGVAVFTLDDDSFKGTFEVVVTDNVNNSNEEPYLVTKENSNILSDNHAIMFDKQAPKVGIVLNGGEKVYKNYYDKDVTLDINVEDAASGLNQVDIYINGKAVARDTNAKWEGEQTAPLTYSYHTKDLQDVIANDGSYVITTTVTDNAGNKTEQTETIFIDKLAPTLVNDDGKAIAFHVETIHDEKWAEFINFLSFGTFFNKKIQLTVKVQDDVSGLKSIKLLTSDETLASVEEDDIDLEAGIAKYTLDVDSFKGIFNVEVTDNVNHQEIYEVTKENSDILSDNSEVMIEKNNPNVNIAINPHENVTSNGGNQYSGDVTFEVTVEDTESGISSDKIVVNNEVIPHDYSADSDKKDKPISYFIETTKDMANEDGSYHISVEVYDNAGNKSSTEETIFIDRTIPIITGYTYSTKEDNGKFEKAEEIASFKDSVELTEYGYYFKKPTRVTVHAEDLQVDKEFTSGVKSMTIYLKDYENGKHYAVQADGSLKTIVEKEIGQIAAVSTNDEVTFDVPRAFKGQIFAKATDFVQHTGAFVTPSGTVIEDKTQHEKESHITLEKAETTYKDDKGLELYNKNVDVQLTVADSYSGLSEIEWSVVAPYDTDKNQKGSIKINNDRTYQEGSDTQGWKQTKTDKNLVTEMQKTINVNHNSNGIVLQVKMKDRAGNTSEEKINFSIDKTAPTIKVTYDNNTADAQYDDFYKDNRTATVVVTERNFSAKDVEYAITNTDGSIPTLVGWTTKANATDPDKTTHTATVKYTADGDYTFDIKYKDNAANQAAPFEQDKFTLDKTNPVISVAYDNNSNANGNYYNSSRTATITITEHNFDTSRIQVTGTASDGVAFPATSGWSTRGDVHTATIQYSADALYSFDIAYTDKAGNIAEDYPMDEFYIDQTAPELSITGVEDRSANNGDVAPVITYSDQNFNTDAVSISLTGANRGPVALAGNFANAENGQVYTFNNFEKEKEVDDLYTLSATLVDYAGNETTESIIFSVNRFGSVYVFDESLKEIEGKYVQQEKDIVLTETNVDNLKPESIGVKVTKNGTPSDLVEGKDYTVTESGGSGKWSQYRYVINKELFASDGRYIVALYSEDAAGNINETIDETKKAEISFGIDKTAPVIVPIDIESGEQYPVENKQVTVSIKDNLVLEDATIYLNGGEVEHGVDGENFTFTMQSSNSKQDVKIVAVDAAGNELVSEVDDILVSTNPIVRWYNNTPLFAGSIGGVGALALSIAAYFIFRNQRKQEDVANEAIGG